MHWCPGNTINCYSHLCVLAWQRFALLSTGTMLKVVLSLALGSKAIQRITRNTLGRLVRVQGYWWVDGDEVWWVWLQVNVLNTLGRLLEVKFVWMKYGCTCEVCACTYSHPCEFGFWSTSLSVLDRCIVCCLGECWRAWRSSVSALNQQPRAPK